MKIKDAKAIDVILNIIQQECGFNEKKKAFHDNALSCYEDAFYYLFELGIIKDRSWVKISELKKYYKSAPSFY